MLPAAGSVLFALLYFIATLYYPGGYHADKSARGFSWIHNYWCNLLGEQGINGEPNAARGIAFSAMVVLCVTMASFAYIFPKQVPFSKRVRIAVQVAGVSSMAVAFFIFTEQHDVLISIASLLGLVGVFGTMIGLRKLRWNNLFWFGIFNLVLVILNNVLYYNEGLMFALPVVQKITFLSFLIWISMISVVLYNKGKITEKTV